MALDAAAVEQAEMNLGTVNNIGFTQFTSGLLEQVWRVILQGTLDQMREYGEFVRTAAMTLADYQKESVGASAAERKTKVDAYITGVLGLTIPPNAADTTLLSLDPVKDADLQSVLAGVTVTVGGTAYTYADPSTSLGTNHWRTATTGSTPGFTLRLGTTDYAAAATVGLRSFIYEKLMEAAEKSRALLINVVRMGLSRLNVRSGRIETRLTFSVGASAYAQSASTDYSRRTTDWAASMAGTSITTGDVKFGRMRGMVGATMANTMVGYLGGSANSTQLNVRVVNESSSAGVNMNAQIIGGVIIEFATDIFPPTDVGGG